MSYTIYITRKNNWYEKGPEIPESDWLATIQKHSKELTLKGSVIRDGKEIPVYVWADTTTNRDYLFYLFNGDINIEHGNEDMLLKAREIANELSARVQGDELELY